MKVLISGTRKGLGRALFESARLRGHHVVGFSSQSEDKTGDGYSIFRCDLQDQSAESTIAQHLASHIGQLDMVICNAGTGSFGSTLGDVDIGEIDRQFQLHCVGALKTVRASIPYLRKSENPRVCLVTSRLGSIENHQSGLLRGRSFSYSYRIAKASQNMLTQCLSNDETLRNITFVSVKPGLLRTDSGSSDAQRTAEEAAERFWSVIGGVTAEANGRHFELFPA